MNSGRAALVVAGIALMLYVPWLHVPFRFDDEAVIKGNSLLRDISMLPKFFLSPTIDARGGFAGSYRPLTMTTLSLQVWLAGLEPWGFRLGNALLHAIMSAVVFFFLGNFRKDRSSSLLPALGGAILFAVHPLQSHTLLLVWKRSGILSALFMMAACLTFLKGAGWRRGAAVLSFFLLALASKEDAVVLPILAGFLVWAGLGERVLAKRRLFLLVSLCALYLPLYLFWVSGGGNAWNTADEAGLGFVALWRTMGLMVWPRGLNIDHCLSCETIGRGEILAAGLGTAGLVVLGILLSFRNRRLTLPFVFLLVPFVPYLFRSVPVKMDEARAYLPLVGFSMMGMMLLQRWGRRAWIGAGMVIVALVLRTEYRAYQWKDGVAVWADSVRRVPNNPRALQGLAFNLVDRGRGREAFLPARTAVRIAPEQSASWMALAQAQDAERDPAAVRSYEKVLALDPQSADAWNNLGAYYGDRLVWERAIHSFRQALLLDPDYMAAQRNLWQAEQMARK